MEETNNFLTTSTRRNSSNNNNISSNKQHTSKTRTCSSNINSSKCECSNNFKLLNY